LREKKFQESAPLPRELDARWLKYWLEPPSLSASHWRSHFTRAREGIRGRLGRSSRKRKLLKKTEACPLLARDRGKRGSPFAEKRKYHAYSSFLAHHGAQPPHRWQPRTRSALGVDC